MGEEKTNGKDSEQTKQSLYLNLNLKKIGEQLESLAKHLEHINWNLGVIAKNMEEKPEKEG